MLPNGSIQTESMDRDAFEAAIGDLNGKWNEWVMAVQKSENVRETRNDTHRLAYECMRDYRQKVENELPAGHALLDSLPLLNPDTSSNPDAPEASGTWNAATKKADLTGTPSTSAGVTHTDVRFCPDAEYDPQNEIVLTSIATGDPLAYSTDIGLGIAGDKSRFQLVAVTADGHEGRSPVVEVERLT